MERDLIFRLALFLCWVGAPSMWGAKDSAFPSRDSFLKIGLAFGKRMTSAKSLDEIFINRQIVALARIGILYGRDLPWSQALGPLSRWMAALCQDNLPRSLVGRDRVLTQGLAIVASVINARALGKSVVSPQAGPMGALWHWPDLILEGVPLGPYQERARAWVNQVLLGIAIPLWERKVQEGSGPLESRIRSFQRACLSHPFLKGLEERGTYHRTLVPFAKVLEKKGKLPSIAYSSFLGESFLVMGWAGIKSNGPRKPLEMGEMAPLQAFLMLQEFKDLRSQRVSVPMKKASTPPNGDGYRPEIYYGIFYQNHLVQEADFVRHGVEALYWLMDAPYLP